MVEILSAYMGPLWGPAMGVGSRYKLGVEVVDVAKRGMVGRAATPVRDCPCLVFDF